MTGNTTGQPGVLPGGAPLAPGETPLVAGSFMLSTIAFFLHTELVLTDRRLVAKHPQTILGLLPVGTKRQSFPIENIAGVSSATRFNIAGVVFGIIGALVGIAALGVPSARILGVALIVIGVACIVGAPEQAIQVQNSGGGLISFPVSVLERTRTVEFTNLMAEAVARTAGRAAYRTESSAPGPGAQMTGGDPSSAMLHLNRLRDQSLITDAEYAAKRAEIVARL